MNGQPTKIERVEPKDELQKIRVQIHNGEHNLQMLRAMEKKLEELSR